MIMVSEEYKDDSIFVWLDILGFSNELKNLDRYETLRNLLDDFRQLFKDSDWVDVSVSDGILLEIPFSTHFWNVSKITDLFRKIADKQLSFLLDKQYVLRGGISVGKSIPDQDRKKGSYISDGMAGAYGLESKHVSWPIVGIDNESLEKLQNHCGCDKNEMFDLKTTFNETGLPIHFLNYSMSSQTAKEDCEKILRILKIRTESLQEKRVMLKYVWLYKYFRETLGMNIPKEYIGWVL